MTDAFSVTTDERKAACDRAALHVVDVAADGLRAHWRIIALYDWPTFRDAVILPTAEDLARRGRYEEARTILDALAAWKVAENRVAQEGE